MAGGNPLFTERQEGDFVPDLEEVARLRPDLFLLDLNMPKLDGRQVLKQIRSIQELRNIRVVVLTTSHQEEDITRSYDLGVHSYITKPVNLDQFFNVIRALEEYWFQIVVLPPKEDK